MLFHLILAIPCQLWIYIYALVETIKVYLSDCGCLYENNSLNLPISISKGGVDASLLRGNPCRSRLQFMIFLSCICCMSLLTHVMLEKHIVGLF